MEFGEKLQDLRRKRGLTQEELAGCLFVSRTAISKWESGRGYPTIDSLKAVAAFFSVTVDELLSSGEVLTLAEAEQKKREKSFLCVVYGLLDISLALLLFLPFFADRAGGIVQGASLLELGGAPLYLRVLYAAMVALTVVWGILTLALQGCEAAFWCKNKKRISLLLGALTVLLFIVGLQPYAAVFSFATLAIKVLILIKR